MNQPINVSNLILTLSYHLFTLLPSPLFPTPHSNSSDQDLSREALNCLRVLGRILVVVYEAERDVTGLEDEEQSFAHKYLWSRSPVEGQELPGEPPSSQYRAGQTVNDSGEEADGQFKIEDSDSEGETPVEEGARAFRATVGHPPSEASGKEDQSNGGPVSDPLTQTENGAAEEEDETDEQTASPCLVDRLFSCTIDLLFCAGFTVPESVRNKTGTDEKINVSRTSGSTQFVFDFGVVCHLGERNREHSQHWLDV